MEFKVHIGYVIIFHDDFIILKNIIFAKIEWTLDFSIDLDYKISVNGIDEGPLDQDWNYLATYLSAFY